MTDLQYETCSGCGQRRRVEFDTDGHGNLVELPGRCGCSLLAGECRDCHAQVEKRRHRICKECKRLKRNATKREWRRANAKRFRRGVKAWRSANPEKVKRYRAKCKKYGPADLPRCHRCDGPVPYTGPGRPRRECPACRVPTRWDGRNGAGSSGDREVVAQSGRAPG